MARLTSLAQRTADVETLEGDIHLPLYRRLYGTIARRIADGLLKPGEGLPAEVDLAKAFGIAPGTARRALDDLVENGLVERKHGLGTYVRRPNFDNAMLRFFRFRDASGIDILPESRIVSRNVVAAPQRVVAALALADGAAIHLVRHRCWEGAIRLVEDIYLPVRPFRPLLTAGEQEIGPLLYPAYDRLCGQVVFSIAEDIAISEASAEAVTQLGIAQGDLIVAVERLARNAMGHPIEWRVSRAEARRFRYSLNAGSDCLL